MVANTSPQQFPHAWAAEWGEDHYGLWQAFIYREARYVFRWIKSGEFFMGSPDDEPERISEGGTFWGAETRHQVTLSEGFWVGETTVTQVLWQAVMGENPSRFSAYQDNPVEQVSWEDSQLFIQTLDQILHSDVLSPFNQSTFVLRLPFEAEWEYACRAGTDTAFSFGENITADQVNYHGGYPYHAGEKGEYRERTVKVRSLPCNDWGLYEMHGNVWEWCEDNYQKYLGASSVMNPVGEKAGVERVVRGGSWYDYGGNVRSAIRNHRSPDGRYSYLGLRLALGQSSHSLQNKKA